MKHTFKYPWPEPLQNLLYWCRSAQDQISPVTLTQFSAYLRYGTMKRSAQPL